MNRPKGCISVQQLRSYDTAAMIASYDSITMQI